ncbi:pantetheine-phosphate adenylyltransferase [Treponema sp. HNW]|uniref:pantetheine-phosphate adenylyltransferase n=1 Tax=Treponema sp. HNW TaxID=3116654 RepID=UPI003D1194A7
MVKALFPGSFDPPTYGHLNILERARSIFPEIDVVIADNKNKKYLFSEEERLAFMRTLTASWDNVEVHVCRSLVVDYARKTGAKVLIRGIRNTADFSYELDLSLLNSALNPEVETLFFPTDSRFFLLKSSAIKELASFGGDVSDMVPSIVEKALKEKFLIQEGLK